MRKKRLLARTEVLFLLLLLCISTFAQNKLISGKVTDSKDGSPLQGVSVIPIGSTRGATTNAKGEFRLSITPGTKSLVFSSVGFATREIPVDGVGMIISLLANNSSLNEIIVIGYGTQKKKDLTGSITTISSKDFQQGAISTPEQLIAGKVAGVVVTPNSGQPGVGSTIRIRGGSSLTASNDPLIVLDGVPLESITSKADGTSSLSGAPSPLSMINPDDIESFTVLKDASATAIYGNRASNGVIIITTKKGKSGGALRVNFNSLNSLAAKTKEVNVFSAAQLRSIVNAQGTTAQKALLGTANTNWQDQVYQKAFTTDNSISLSGGIKHLPYRVSLGYLDNNGILKTGYLKRKSAALNLSPVLLDNHLHIDLNLKGVYADNRFASSGAIGEAVRMDPTQPVYDKSSPYAGYFEWQQGNIPNVLATRNPVGDLMSTRDISTVKRSIGNIQLDYSLPFLPELRANMNIGYDISKAEGGKYIDPKSALSYTNGGSQSAYSQYRRTKLFDFYLNYAKDLPSISSRLDLTAGYEYEDFYRASPATVTRSVTGSNPVNNASAQTTYGLPDSSENTLLSYYGRLNYTFEGRYLLTATIRRDGSSRFAPNNRYGTFPSVALAWRINQESFLKNAPVFSDLKLRLGYGVTGNQDIFSNYGYLANYTLSTATTQYQFGDSSYHTYRGEAYAANIQWEQTASYDAGLDFGFFQQRLSGSLDFYYKKTTNLLLDVNQPSLSNLSNHVITNVGNVENRGVELNINALAVTTKDFNWNLGFNFSYYKNKITKLSLVTDTTSPGYQVGSIGGGTGNQIQINSIGYPVNAFYIYKQVYDQKGIPVEGVYADVNKNGGKNLFYRYKSPNPSATIGLSSQFGYKSWSLAFALHGSFGNYMYNNVKSNLGTFSSISNPNNYIGNASTDYLHTNFQNAQYLSDYYVENASFVRMDNISLGYNFGKVIQKKINLRLSAIVQNAFVITKYTGLDPEIPGGIDNNIYPKPRIYSLGINLDY